MVVKYTWNIDTASISYEKAIDAIRSSGADYALIMLDPKAYYLGAGDIATIKKYLADLPNVTLIVRTFSDSQGNWQNYPDAIPNASGKRTKNYETHWTWIKAQLGDLSRRVILDSPFNEPNLDDNPVNAKKFVDYCIYLVQSASNAGMKLAIGAFSVGLPDEDLLPTVYLPLWQECARLKQGVSLHLYATPIPEIGEFVGLDTVLDTAKSRAAIVDTKWPIEMQGWFIGRAYRIIKIFADNGLGIPEFYVTEGIIDNPFNSQTSWIKEAWRAKWGLLEYDRDPRGALTWGKWLIEVFKQEGFNPEQALAHVFRHARKNVFHHKAFKCICIFAKNAQWGLAYEHHPKGTNYGAGSNFDYPALRTFSNTYLPAINAEIYPEDIPPMPIPFPATDSPLWRDGTLTLNAVRLRSQPDINPANVVTTLTGTFEAKRHEDEKPILEDGYTWHAFRFVDKDIVRNVWLAAQVVTWVEKPPIPPVSNVYAVNIYGYEKRGTKEELKAYADFARGIFGTIQDILDNPIQVENP